MFINKSNQLYKPERILYYIDADDSIIGDFYNGIINEDIKKYSNSFGTYDYPGIFYVKKLEKIVLGIEFRLNDKRIDYPNNLNSVILEEKYFYSIELDNDVKIDESFIKDILIKIKLDDDAHRVYTDLKIDDNYDTISIFTSTSRVYGNILSISSIFFLLNPIKSKKGKV